MANINDSPLPPIEFIAAGETPDEKQNNLDLVLPSPGFATFAHMMAEITAKRSVTSVLDFTAAAVNVRFQIDGIWHSMPPIDRETGDYMAATLKQIAGMVYQDRRNRQEGKFEVEFMREKTKFKVVSQGVPTGERIVILADIEKPDTDDLEQCGMRPKMIAQLKEILNGSDPSLTLTTAMPGEGYTTAWRVTLSAADRLMRDYFVLEEKDHVEEEVVNVSSITYDESAGETPMSPIPKLLLREPHVLAFSELKTGALINEVCDLSTEHSLPILTRIPGKNAIDGLLRFLLLKPDRAKTIDLLQIVVSMRLIRILCKKCRVPFVPNPTLLQQLGIPQGRVRHLYQPFVFQPGMVDEEDEEIEICNQCHGLGYKHQTGIFELLVVDEPFRKAIKKTPRVDQLTAFARSKGHVSIREEGILMVARGMTSLEELQRVLGK